MVFLVGLDLKDPEARSDADEGDRQVSAASAPSAFE